MTINFHDATLTGISLDWPTKTVDLAVEIEERGTVHIKCRGFVRVIVPREEPWGPSVSINGISEPAKHEIGIWALRVEMQTGDMIEILAESFELPD